MKKTIEWFREEFWLNEISFPLMGSGIATAFFFFAGCKWWAFVTPFGLVFDVCLLIAIADLISYRKTE
ncbi:MAG: hypothetical protein M0P97_01265 [Candidatus Moranbacteria bacterium]|jgi:hypothetical protein|nr:hypothetical protein [Candidatus Moranbacteria bacterium]